MFLLHISLECTSAMGESSGDSIIDITGLKSENKKSHSKPHAAKNNPCFLY
jgi:hypothetical protein